MILLVGESGSGKTTVAKLLQDKGFNIIVSVTTRPQRFGEVNGIDYNFVTIANFKQLIEDGVLMEYTKYNGNYYGALKPNNPDNKVIVVEVEGLQAIQEEYKGTNKVKSFYLNVSENTRAIRMLQRGDNIENVYKRIINDRVAFVGIEDLVDYIIEDDELENIVNIILKNV